LSGLLAEAEEELRPWAEHGGWPPPEELLDEAKAAHDLQLIQEVAEIQPRKSK